MSDLPDYELRRTGDESSSQLPSQPPSLGVWIAIAMLIVAAAAAIYVVFGRQPSSAPTSATAGAPGTAPKAASTPPLGAIGEQIALPPLDETDPLVRRLVRTLSSNPTIATWLASDGLIRNFVVVVANIADGATPTKHLRRLSPSAPFRSVQRGGSESVDPQSYRRYDVFADALSSIDPADAARLYGTLKPRIEDAAAELGYPGHQFDAVLERAIVALLRTPIVNQPVLLKPKGIGYAYADDRLESLSGAQKQLLRMGPENVQRVQARLREIALALGISPSAVRP